MPFIDGILTPSRSRDWVCPDCGVPNVELLPDPEPKASSSSESAQPEPEAGQTHDHSHSSAPDSDVPSPEITVTQATPPALSQPLPRLHVDPPYVARPRQDLDMLERKSPPMWMDASIIAFTVLVAYLAGKRFLNVWDFVASDFN